MSETNNTELRLTKLERFAEAVTSRQDDEDQLHEGVSRLSDETNALNALLTRVDEQQQTLNQLDTRTHLVEETAVSREELITAAEEQEKEAFRFRKETLNRIYFTAWIIVIALFMGGVTFFEYSRNVRQKNVRVCIERNEQYDILINILKGVIADTPQDSPETSGSTAIREGIRRLENKLIDCEADS